MLRIFSLNNENAIFTGENVFGEFLFLNHFCTPYLLFDTLLLSLHFIINYLHHLQKLFLGENSFLDKQSGEGFLLNHLGHQKFFKGNDLFGVEGVAIETSIEPR